jgi:hypothetical protein
MTGGGVGIKSPIVWVSAAGCICLAIPGISFSGSAAIMRSGSLDGECVFRKYKEWNLAKEQSREQKRTKETKVVDAKASASKEWNQSSC